MGSSEGQTYCLRWNNHKTNLVEILDILIKMEYYVDCTIVVDEHVQFKAHRVILAANSPYFQTILMDVPMDHCSILFPGVKEFEMRALLEYMYTGEVNVTQSQIPRIMRIAEQLEVKGLFDMTELRQRFREEETRSPPCPATPAPAHSSCSPPRWLPPAPAPASARALSSSYESASDMNPLKRKKLSSISSMLLSRDTPILRNVLAQSSAADSSQPAAGLLCQPVPPVAPMRLGPDRPERLEHPDRPDRLDRLDRPDRPERPDRSDRLHSNGSLHDSYKHHRTELSEEAHSPYTDKSYDDDSMNRSLLPSSPPQNFPSDLRCGIAPYVPQQKPEWKRYKQYTRTDIMSAIECVRNGMSALQASRKFGVPSRTLYDKVKKLGITTSRPMNRSVKRESNGSPGSLGGGWPGSREEEALHPASLLDPGFLQQALEGRVELGGREAALHAMALAAAAHAAAAGLGPASSPPRAPSPGVLKYVRRASPSPPRPSRPNGLHPEETDDEDRVEDLSVSRKPDPDPPGVIVPPMNQVSAIIKKEDALRDYRDDYRDDARRGLSIDCGDRD